MTVMLLILVGISLPLYVCHLMVANDEVIT